MYKLPQRLPNTTSAWGQGLWLGRCTLNNEDFVGTETGQVVRVRTIKRLPLEQQANKALLENMKGTPLQPKGSTDDSTLILQPAILAQHQFTSGNNKQTEQQQDTLTDEQQKQRPLSTNIEQSNRRNYDCRPN